jgi:hypothetical protein
MRTVGQLVVLAVCLNLATVTVAGAQSLVYTQIDFPGAVSTNTQGINAQGEIVGTYTDTGGRMHGFVLSGGQFRSIDFPGSRSTIARGIGPAGDIVGSFQRPDEPGTVPVHGFLLTRRGEFFQIDYPGHQNTIAQRILPDGTILGCYHDSDTMMTMHGMSISRDGFEEIDAFASMHNGATPGGHMVVGLFTDMMDGRSKGYIIERGEFSALEVPGSIFTAAWDVNPAGVVVGVYRDAGGVLHGFEYDGDAFYRIDVPGATATRAFGVNPRGDMVGVFVDAAGRTHGFLAERAHP